MKKTLALICVSWTLFLSYSVNAFVFTVSEEQLNGMLQFTFPISQSYQGITATFHDPVIKLDSPDQIIRISTTITAIQDGKKLIALGTIDGVFDYDILEQQLRFKKPTLRDFKILENQIEGSEHAIATIKQTIGQNLPIIILVDFKQLNFGMGDIAPKEITITPKGLAMYY